LFAQFDKRDCAMSSFFDSQMLMALEKWQLSGKPSLMETSELLRKILHVLQEEFTGFKLGANVNDGSLYITLRRRQEGYRQNVQLLLAEIPKSSFSLEWRQTNKQFEPFGHILLLKAKYTPAEMKLDLPFLDFVLMRDAGEVGQRLNPGYRDRIEKFKSDLMNDTNNNAGQDQKLKLIELDSSGHFNTRTLVIDNKQLQVM
jgi:hypothetical protein